MTTKKLAANSDELTAAMERLESWSTANRFTYESEAKLASCIDTVLVALERAMPLLPLADILKLLEDQPHLATVELGAIGPYRWAQLGYGNKLEGKGLSFSDAIRALLQAVESEATP